MQEIPPPKILVLADDFSKGGAARVIETLINGLSSDFEPVLVCLDAVGKQGESLKRQGIEVFCMDRQPGIDWKLILRLAKLIKEQNTALVHAHQHTAYFYGTLAAIAVGGSVKVIFTEHGRHYPDVRKPKRVLINKFLLTRTAAVTAVSEAVKESLVTYEGIPSRRISLLVNGIDIERFRLDVDETAIRKELGVKSDAFLIGMIARLGEEKDHETFLRAMQLICKDIPLAYLLIVGDGPKKTKLEQLAVELGVAEKVIFTGKRHDVPKLTAVLDLVVLSSFYEGTSITLLEAMAAGKAVIASRVGGNPQVVVDGETGLLFKQGDAHDLARKIISLVIDNSLRKQMGDQGYKRAAEIFSSERMVKEYERLYWQVLGPTYS